MPDELERPMLSEKISMFPAAITEIKEAAAEMTKIAYRDKLVSEGMPFADAQTSTDGHDCLFVQLFNRANSKVLALFNPVTYEADIVIDQSKLEEVVRQIFRIYTYEIIDYATKVMQQQQARCRQGVISENAPDT